MIFKESYIYNLTILRLKSQYISKLSNEQLYLEYRKTFKVFVDTDKKYDREHPEERKDLKIGNF